jgi:hypothetical protein
MAISRVLMTTVVTTCAQHGKIPNVAELFALGGGLVVLVFWKIGTGNKIHQTQNG